jgi:ATP-dependent metalloprotease
MWRFKFAQARSGATIRKQALFRTNATTSTTSNHQHDRLIRMEEVANRKPQDTYLQDSYLRELIRQGYADLAVARHESGRFATSESVLREARRSLTGASQRLSQDAGAFNTTRGESVRLGNIFEHANASGQYGIPSYAGSEASMAPAAGMLQGASSSTPGEPIYVQIVEGNVKTQMWKTVRSVLSTIAVFAALGLFIDFQTGGGITGGGAGGGAPGAGPGGPRGVLGMRSYEVQPDADKKTFKDVKGANEVKKELEEVVSYLKDPSKYTRLGGKLPKGLLLTGPPGTGKTLVAKAVAGEAGVPFFYASGSEFEELYVGVGARRVRDLFSAARKRAPCIIFIDEIDAVGSTRQLKEQQSMKMTLNQLLVELDGFTGSQGVIVLAATNFPETLDPALVRPGRFDRVVAVPLPDVKGRQEILSFYLEKIPKAADVNIEHLARATTGMSGAELANLVNVAAITAATLNANSVSQKHLEEALDRVIMGNERGSAVVPEEVRRVTAFHEGGHALVALRTEGAMPVHKATIVPRGHALGRVQQLPEEKDTMQMSKKQMFATMDILMAGRVAEEMIFGSDYVTSGASNDLVKATKLAHDMVASYGMLPESPVGLEVVDRQNSSSETRRLVDVEVRGLLDASYNRVKALLLKHRKDLDTIANALLEKETLSADELKSLLKIS